MKAMSIIGIVLFTWLLYNRYIQYETAVNSAGKTVTYTYEMTERLKHYVLPQIFASAYALVYAICGTVYFFRKMNAKNGV